MNEGFYFRSISCYLEEYFVEQGMNVTFAIYLNLLINLSVLLIAVLILNYLIRRFLIEAFKTFTNKTKTTFDDFLVKSRFPIYVGQIVPLILINYTIQFILINHQFILKGINLILHIYGILLVIWILRSLLRTTKNYLKTREVYRDKPIDSYIQVIIIFVWIIGVLFIISELTEQSVVTFVLSLGAASAILLLIFKDTILGFVASIQVSVNDIVRIGDWITFSKFGADGTVTEINLATVRVQNWDNTYTTIPTYSLIADSFQNWRGMQESPGRRIKRSVFIKQNSVRFVSAEDIEIYKKISLIKPYLEHRQKEINKFNTVNNVDKELPINGRNQTNLGIFRKYIDAYLHDHSAVHKEMYIIVRHQAPTSQGIPVEILCFSRDKKWENFEYISADIFDHLIAAVPYFNLKIFESPSGDDVREYISSLPTSGE